MAESTPYKRQLLLPSEPKFQVRSFPENISLSKKKTFQPNIKYKNFHDVSKIRTLGYRE
jgi:hypothetical protein